MRSLRLLRIDTFVRYHDRIKKSRILTCFGVACPGSEDNFRGLFHESGVIYALICGVSCDLALCKLLDFGFELRQPFAYRTSHEAMIREMIGRREGSTPYQVFREECCRFVALTPGH